MNKFSAVIHINHINQRGFTLIELLVVISIIGLLSSVVLTSLGSARVKARDARRLSDFKQLQIALELYYSDNGKYPSPFRHWSTNTGWDGAFATALAPYISPIPHDPVNVNPSLYGYSATDADDAQTYGLLLILESSSNFDLADNDGGYINSGNGQYYEVGSQPAYCMNAYPAGPNQEWWVPVAFVCAGGN